MGTEEKSHAWIDLDSVKLAKMDEDSEIEIQKEGKALELSEADAEAYLGLADLRIRQQDYEGVLSLLEEGLEKAGDDAELTEKIAELESGTITDAQHRRRRYSFFDEGGSLA